MTPLHRPTPPGFLSEKAAAWGREFAARRAAQPGYAFQWREHEGVAVNHLLLRVLLTMTRGHCAYCDHFQLGEGSRETIDHFQPKGGARGAPELVYEWENLFPACDLCQQIKGDRFDDALPRPDSVDYEFRRFFLFNSRTGDIEINPTASDADRRSASLAISIFGFNEGVRPTARRRWFTSHFAPRRWSARRAMAIDTLPYRFLAPGQPTLAVHR